MGFEKPAFGRRRAISARAIAEQEAQYGESQPAEETSAEDEPVQDALSPQAAGSEVESPATPNPATPNPATPTDDANRIIPEEVWEGDAGDTLTEMGLHPDSPANQRPTQESANERFEEEFAKQRTFLDQVNAQLPEGASVVAYAMLPWDLWNGRFGELLAMRCALWAPGAWNQMLLAAEEQSSAILGLPQHPGGYPQGLNEEVERLLDEAHAPIAAMVERSVAQQSLNVEQLDAYGEAYNDLTKKVIAMSHYLGSMCIGEEAFNRHKEIFGMNVGWY